MADGRIAGTLKRISPPWLQRTRGAALLGAFGDVLDKVLDYTGGGIRARFPGDANGLVSGDLPTITADSLPSIGRERRISRGINETDEVYAARLRRWWIDHQKRGGAIAMLRQLEAFWATSPKRISLRYPSGTWWTLDTDGTITKTTHSTNADLSRWARLQVVYELDADPGTISYATYSAMMQVPREWIAGHVLLTVLAVWPGGEMWCDDGIWTNDGVLWGGGIVISDLYPDGVPIDAGGVTVGGSTITIGGSPLTVTV